MILDPMWIKDELIEGREDLEILAIEYLDLTIEEEIGGLTPLFEAK